MATIGALESACPCCSRRERACRRRAMPVAVRHTISQTRSFSSEFSSRSPAPALTTQVPSQRNGTAAPLSICHSRQNPQSPKSQNIHVIRMWRLKEARTECRPANTAARRRWRPGRGRGRARARADGAGIALNRSWSCVPRALRCTQDSGLTLDSRCPGWASSSGNTTS